MNTQMTLANSHQFETDQPFQWKTLAELCVFVVVFAMCFTVFNITNEGTLINTFTTLFAFSDMAKSLFVILAII